MKYIFIIAALLFTAGCKEDAPVVVTPQPPVVEPVKPVEPVKNWDAEQAFCKEEGAKFNCGNPVWYGLKGCKPDSDGDNQAEGTYFAKDLAEIEALAKSSGGAIKIKMKDGSTVQYGVGFAAPCEEI
jgi:hypothetical protein